MTVIAATKSLDSIGRTSEFLIFEGFISHSFKSRNLTVEASRQSSKISLHEYPAVAFATANISTSFRARSPSFRSVFCNNDSRASRSGRKHKFVLQNVAELHYPDPKAYWLLQLQAIAQYHRYAC